MSATLPQVMSWPLEGIDENGKWQYASDDGSVREVIRNILLTRPGERLRYAVRNSFALLQEPAEAFA